MKILFLGDIVGDAGFKSVKKNLPNIVSKKGIDLFVLTVKMQPVKVWV